MNASESELKLYGAKKFLQKLKLFSRSCDVWENWKHSRVYLGLVADGCNSLQFPPLFNTVSTPTSTADVPFRPPFSPPAVFCESFIFSGHHQQSKLMSNYKNWEALKIKAMTTLKFNVVMDLATRRISQLFNLILWNMEHVPSLTWAHSYWK